MTGTGRYIIKTVSIILNPEKKQPIRKKIIDKTIVIFKFSDLFSLVIRSFDIRLTIDITIRAIIVPHKTAEKTDIEKESELIPEPIKDINCEKSAPSTYNCEIVSLAVFDDNTP